jgi:hypothetical protein
MLQEVLPAVSLEVVAAFAGYRLWPSMKATSRRMGDYSFLHLHILTATDGRGVKLPQERDMLRRLQPRLQRPTPPILLGGLLTAEDVQGAAYNTDNFSSDMVREYFYQNACRVLFPAVAVARCPPVLAWGGTL